MQEFVTAVDLFSMEPRNDLLSDREDNEAYCLAETGQQYAVFFTGDGDGSVRIELAAVQQSLELRWLDVATSRWTQRSTLRQRGEYLLKTPGNGHWVAVLGGQEPATGPCFLGLPLMALNHLQCRHQ